MSAEAGDVPPTESVGPPLLVDEPGEYILRVMLNRPRHLNAVSPDMRQQLVDTWQGMDTDTCRALIITGAGERAFCVGMDLKILAEHGEYKPVPPRLADHTGITPLHNDVWTPTIVAVNGVCTGAGLQFIANADIVIGSSQSSYLDTHVSVGQVSVVEPLPLIYRIGLGNVLKMTLLGKHGRISAEDALRIGLIDEIVEPHLLQERALELARLLTTVSPTAAVLSKRAIRQAMELPLEEARQFGWDLLVAHRDHADALEGVRAFAEKREPKWEPLHDLRAKHRSPHR